MLRSVRSMMSSVLVAAIVGTALAGFPQTVHAAPDTGVRGAPWTWGGNGDGQLGDGTTTARLSAGPVALDNVVDMHGGREHVIALRSDGTAWTWGSNAEGQLGIGTSGNRTTPVQVPGLSDVVAVETGHNFSLALRGDGTVWSWGLNSDGQLGDGTTTLRRAPVQVTGLTDAVAIAAGRDMSYAIRADHSVVAWGRNAEGQLGDGTTTARRTPTPVHSLNHVTRIAGGRDHGLAVKTDGTVWAWGWNQYGQVGDGTTTDRTTPVQVQSGVVDVAGGAHHSYALMADGRVSSWGRNYRANLGDGTMTMRTRPVLVQGVSDAVSLGSGRDSGVVVLADGRVRTWGHNASGQLGDGSTTNRTSAITVPGVSSAVKAAGGGSAYLVVLVGSRTDPVNQPPTASFTVACELLSCSFDASASEDPDGLIVEYDWDFGDGRSSDDSAPSHVYTDPGTYVVSLTVRDDDDATATTSKTAQAQTTSPPEPATFRASATADSNTQQPSVQVPVQTQPGDQLLLIVSTNRAATASTPTGWSLVGTVSDGTDIRSWLFTKLAVPTDPGSSIRSTLDAYSKTSVTLLAYGNASAPSATSASEPGNTTDHIAPAMPGQQPAGAAVVRYWADKSSSSRSWVLPAQYGQLATTSGSGGGMVSSVTADLTLVDSANVAPATARSSVSSSKAISWTIVLPAKSGN